MNRGTVTLTGTVESWAKLRAAAEAAHRVVGVLDVANDLTVKLPGNTQKTDTEIAQAVRHALAWDTLVPHQKIETTVSHAVVTLEGQVAYWSQRYDAERAVEHLTGVRRVNNRIRGHAGRPHPRGRGAEGGRQGSRAACETRGQAD